MSLMPAARLKTTPSLTLPPCHTPPPLQVGPYLQPVYPSDSASTQEARKTRQKMTCSTSEGPSQYISRMHSTCHLSAKLLWLTRGNCSRHQRYWQRTEVERHVCRQLRIPPRARGVADRLHGRHVRLHALHGLRGHCLLREDRRAGPDPADCRAHNPGVHRVCCGHPGRGARHARPTHWIRPHTSRPQALVRAPHFFPITYMAASRVQLHLVQVPLQSDPRTAKQSLCL